MTQIKEKLNSNSGASMMLALALMLVCVFVSSIILTAAASGASRNEERSAQQREYLAVSSAAEFLQENLKNAGTLAGQTTIKTYQCNVYMQMEKETVNLKPDGGETVPYTGYPISWDATAGYPNVLLMLKERDEDGNIPEGANEGDYFCKNERILEINEEKTKFNGLFKELMERAAKTVFETEIAYKENFYLYVPGEQTEENGRIPKVKCEFTMNAGYEVSIDIFVENGVSHSSMLLTMGAVKDINNTAGSVYEATCEHSHPVVSFVINEDKKVIEAKDGVQKFTRFNACPTIEITWLEPQLSKGGK